MDDAGWRVVLLIWLSLVWPIMSTGLVYALRAGTSPALHKRAYWIMSVSMGGVLACAIGLGVRRVAREFMFSDGAVYLSLMAASLLLAAVVPFLVSLYVARMLAK